MTDPTTDLNFFAVATDAATGVNTVTVTASATVPTTFMRLANFTNLTVTSSGEATRRMVDLSLVLDVSVRSRRSGPRWPTPRDSSSAPSIRTTIACPADVRKRRPGARCHAIEPWVQQVRARQRRAEHAAGRQHQHGGRPLPGVGRIAVGADGHAVGSQSDRAVHRRRLERRACELGRAAGNRESAPHVGLPGSSRPIPTTRRTSIRRSTACTTRPPAATPDSPTA